MNIAIVVAGYVGLVSGARFAETDSAVNCVEIDEEKVQRLHNGERTSHTWIYPTTTPILNVPDINKAKDLFCWALKLIERQVSKELITTSERF